MGRAMVIGGYFSNIESEGRSNIGAHHTTTLLTRYSTVIGLPSSTTNRPLAAKTSVSSSFSLSSPVSNVRWMTIRRLRNQPCNEIHCMPTCLPGNQYEGSLTRISKPCRLRIRTPREHQFKIRCNPNNPSIMHVNQASQVLVPASFPS